MKAIRESEWFGLGAAARSRSRPHATGGLGTLSARRLRRHPRGRRCPRWTRSPPPTTSSSASSPGPTRRPVAAASWSPARSPQRAEELGVPVLKPEHPRDPDFQAALRALAPGLLPGRRVRRAAAAESALDIPRHGWVNLHFSCLPAWRGAAPVQHALWAGDEVTGATTFRIVKELDAGPTFGVMTERIRPTDTAGDLLGRLAEGGAGLLVATLDGIEDGSLEARAQPADGRLLRAEDHGRRRRRSTGPSRRSASTGRSAPARRRPARGRRTTASGSSSGRSPSPTSRLDAGAARGRQEPRCWSAPAPTPYGSATSRRSASGRCRPPTGRAGSGCRTPGVRELSGR